jgi:hypothetical protein
MRRRDKYTQKEGVMMDAREELKRWIALVIELSAEEESKVIKQDIDVLLSAAGTLTGTLADVPRQHQWHRFEVVI